MQCLKQEFPAASSLARSILLSLSSLSAAVSQLPGLQARRSSTLWSTVPGSCSNPRQHATAEGGPNLEIPRPKTLASSTQKVAVIGLIGQPNAGKSQLTNALCGVKVSGVSPVANTTVAPKLAAYTRSNTQIVLRDLPGIQARQPRGQGSLAQATWGAASECSALMLVVDAHQQFMTRSDAAVTLAERAAQLSADIALARNTPQRRPPLLLVWNKMDQLAAAASAARAGADALDSVLVSMQRRLQRVALIEKCFRVSALTGAGVPELRAYLPSLAVRGAWMLPADEATDQMPEQLAHELVRARLLQRLPPGVSVEDIQLHSMGVEEEASGGGGGMMMRFKQVLFVPSESVKAALLGRGGDLRARVLQPAEADLSRTLGMAAAVQMEIQLTQQAQGARAAPQGGSAKRAR